MLQINFKKCRKAALFKIYLGSRRRALYDWASEVRRMSVATFCTVLHSLVMYPIKEISLGAIAICSYQKKS